MYDVLMQLFLFSAKSLILVILILLLLVGIIAILSKGKEKMRGHLSIKDLGEKYKEVKNHLMQEVLNKDQLKKYNKGLKQEAKLKKKKPDDSKKNVFVLNFNGDIKATPVAALREEVSAILGIATPQDEVVLRLESGGGMVHAYGLAAAQLARLREHQIPLTVSVDKVAASGGYLMACVANKIIAAPFAIIGSIGVIVQMPNFNRWLKEKHIDFEQLTAGSFKRTLTLFGHNTEEARDKLKQEIEEIHHLFQASILKFRPDLEMAKVATGEHWLGLQAIELNLVDEILTSDDYLMKLSQTANVYEMCYEIKKPLTARLMAGASALLKRDGVGTALLRSPYGSETEM